VKAAHNPVLAIVVNAINDSLRDSIFRSKLSQEMRARVVSSHRSIFEALRNHDAVQAQKAMGDHVLAVQGHLEARGSKKPIAK